MTTPLYQYKNSLGWLREARKVTPCGAQTLSKRAESYVEGAYPCFIESGEGATVTDLDGQVYIDLICSLGAVMLGHGHPYIQDAITRQLARGVNFPLPSSLETVVARQLVEMIPCAEQVRFVKTGSEACAGAARIARMVTERDVILYCGYHGWMDGYVSSCDYTVGIPEDYSSYNIKFPYNDLYALDQLLQEHHGNVAAIMMEPMLVEFPDAGYIQAVKDLVHDHGALLIFDEMICSGRWALAGGQEYFHVIPDLAVYGKFLGNGLPLACIAGPERYMKHAWMVSGTFGGELLSLAACQAVLQLYKKTNFMTIQSALGRQLAMGMYEDVFLPYDIPGIITGPWVRPVIRFTETGEEMHNRLCMSVFLQEMAKRGVLMHQSGLNISAALTDQQVQTIRQAAKDVCALKFWENPINFLEGYPYKDAVRTRSG